MSKRKMEARIKNMILTIMPIVAVAGGALYYGNNHLAISKYNIKSSKIPKAFNGFKILQLSDLHSKTFGNRSNKLIEAIDKEKPDIIVMTGDMINSYEGEFNVFLDLARRLRKYKVYFIEGNNETKLQKNRNAQLMIELIDIGIQVLDNTKVKLISGGASINLYGIWCSLCYYREVNSGYKKDTYFEARNLDKTFGKCNDEEFNILLAHNPLYFDSYAKWGADLTFSGHIHGGVVRLPGIGGLLSPERKFFPKYSEGVYNIDDKKLIVNRGLGGKPFLPRVFNMPEISVVTLENNS